MILEKSFTSIEEEAGEGVVSLARNRDFVFLCPYNNTYQGHDHVQRHVELRNKEIHENRFEAVLNIALAF